MYVHYPPSMPRFAHELTPFSHNSTFSRGDISDHRRLHRRQRCSNAQSVLEGKGCTPESPFCYHTSFGLPRCDCDSGMVAPPPSTSQFHSMDYLQRQQTTPNLCQRLGCRWYRGWHCLRHCHHPQLCQPWLESSRLPGPVHRYCDPICRLERHVCGTNDFLTLLDSLCSRC